MPRTSNDIDYVKVKDPRTKTAKNPPPEPGPLPPFLPLLIDDWYDPGEASVPPGLDRHDPMALFRLFFTDEMMDTMVQWTNEYAEQNQPTEESEPGGRARPWKPTNRQEL